MSESHQFSEPIAFTVGTVGEPGSRVFFLQTGDVMTHVSIKCEKQQAAALADYLEGILEDLPASGSEPATPVEPMEPIDLEWVAGVIAVAYDEAVDRIVVVIEELTDEEAETDLDGPATVRVALTRTQVATFIEQARAAVNAGRPPCRLCGKPIDPAGHACPRLN